jgi:hypothetical protein
LNNFCLQLYYNLSLEWLISNTSKSSSHLVLAKRDHINSPGQDEQCRSSGQDDVSVCQMDKLPKIGLVAKLPVTLRCFCAKCLQISSYIIYCKCTFYKLKVYAILKHNQYIILHYNTNTASIAIFFRSDTKDFITYEIFIRINNLLCSMWHINIKNIHLILRAPSSKICSNVAQKLCNGKLLSFIVSVLAFSCSTQSKSKKYNMQFETVKLKSHANRHKTSLLRQKTYLLNCSTAYIGWDCDSF